ALRVMAAWGFAYKSHVVWDKGSLGTGYWFRNQHELLLVGTRGDIPAPAMGTQLQVSRRLGQGQPRHRLLVPQELIEGYFPNLPKIEMNARTARPGWDVWGAEAPEAVVIGVDLSSAPDLHVEAVRRPDGTLSITAGLGCLGRGSAGGGRHRRGPVQRARSPRRGRAAPRRHTFNH
ncbi:MT-A70 family methyltransferase, partial [Lysobacter sp. TAB13]|uniref:MT-A70 family methyltransferase n=1 Tax=Lysobacter sp. TAB13 TaxID=3233065 RepID=UPI003F9745FD